MRVILGSRIRSREYSGNCGFALKSKARSATSGLKFKKKIKIFRGSFRGAKFLFAYTQSIFKVFFLSFGPKKIFSVELLRPLVSVNNYFLKFLIF